MTPGVRGGMIAEARLCLGCGEPFIARRHNQLRHHTRCGRADTRDNPAKNKRRDTRRASGITEFVAIDGEGVTDPETGEHVYVLLTCGDKHLSFDGAHLDFLDILEFLWSCFEPEKAYVGFYLSYDWGQWFKTLPLREAFSLYHPQGGTAISKSARFDVRSRLRHTHKEAGPRPVQYEGWQFDLIPGKRFRFRRWVYKKGVQGPKYMSICDAGHFFQTSFLKAIDPTKSSQPVVSPQEYDMLQIGKARRATAELDPEMLAYNELECAVLPRLMAQYDEGLRAMDLKLERANWYGPGQVANVWLKSVDAPTGDTIRAATSEAVREAARGSYFGGWFELMFHGRWVGIAYEYDINSAYPWIMSRLPCLLHGTWHHEPTRREKPRRLTQAEMASLGRTTEDGGFALIRAELVGAHTAIGAMLHRTHQGRVLRPHHTAGWFWAEELAACYAAGLIDRIRVHEMWWFEQHCDCPPPLRGLAELYEQRLRVGKNTPAGLAYRLTYNSAYGKLTQSIGDPKWSNPIYASAITSGCRTMITKAIGSHPKGARAVLMTATDSVIFAEPHPLLSLDEAKLGAWTPKQKHNPCFWRPGIYWDDAARELIAKGETPAFKSRGLSARDFARHIATADRAWDRFQSDGWPQLLLPDSFQVVSPKQALARHDWSQCGMRVKDEPRWIKSHPREKRVSIGPGFSMPYQYGSPVRDIWSRPYDGTFGESLREQDAQKYGDYPDDDPRTAAKEMLSG